MKANKDNVVLLLKTARGHIEGILKMIDDDRYCVDISNQLLAVNSLIQKANKEIIKGHMEGCLIDAIKNGNGDKKIDEILMLIDKWK